MIWFYHPHDLKISNVLWAAGMSGGSTTVSFFTETLPVLQWISVLVGIVAGVLAIILAVKKLRS